MRKSQRYFQNLWKNVNNLHILGSSALQLCYIACGRLDGFIEVVSDNYATPAGKLILEEAGGIVTDEKGEIWKFDSICTVGSNKQIHQSILKIIN